MTGENLTQSTASDGGGDFLGIGNAVVDISGDCDCAFTVIAVDGGKAAL